MLVLLMLWQQWQEDYAEDVEPLSEQLLMATEDVELPALPAERFVSSTDVNGTKLDLPAFTTRSQPEQYVSIETDLLRVYLSEKGGAIRRVELLDYPVSLQEVDRPIVMLNDQPDGFYIVQGGLLSEADSPRNQSVYSVAQQRYTLEDGEDELLVPLFWESEGGLRVKKIYRFSRDSYLINVQYQVENDTDEEWVGYAYSQFKKVDQGRASKILYTYTGAALSSPEKRYQKISFGDIRDEALSVDITTGWVAMLQHYFVSALIPVHADQSYHYYAMTAKDDDYYIVGQRTPPVVVPSQSTAELEQQLYIGPKIQARLEAIAEGLELTVDFGVLWFLANPLFWCLEKFHGITGNWGWAIVLVTVMLKLLFFHLSAAGYRSMANMRRVQPRLLAIRDRYKSDRMKLNQAMMGLYKEEKINPLGGCFPILVQIPVFIALYWVLLESVELRQSAFIFWIKDLSTPDPFYVLPLLMGITMFIQQQLNPMPMDPIQQKIMSILPIVFTVFFAFFPSGLVLYWVANNVLSITQQWVITRNIQKTAIS